MSVEKQAELKLTGAEWIEQPLRRIEYHVGRNAGRKGSRGGERGEKAGSSRGGAGGGYNGRGRGEKSRGQQRNGRLDRENDFKIS